MANPELFGEHLPPPLASVIRKHFTSDTPRTGRPDDLANDTDCDRSSVFNWSRHVDMVARKVRKMVLALGKEHPALARDVFDALGFREAGYAIVTQAEFNRLRAAVASLREPREAGEAT